MEKEFQKALELKENQNYSKAKEIFLRLAENNYPAAFTQLGELARKGFGEEINLDLAFEYYQKGANLGDSASQYKLANIYIDEDSKHYNKGLAIEWYTCSAENGNILGTENLAKVYYYGLGGVEVNYELAFKYCSLISNAPGAQCLLGTMYKKGLGVPKNIDKAIEWYSLATEQGDDAALYYLGCIYYFEDYDKQDYKKAFEYFSLAAKQGDKYAQNKLGSMYEDGDGVPQNIDKAIEWYSLAAEQGDDDAQYYLGCIYYFEDYGKQNFELALKYFTLAASQDNKDAQNKLGLMYEDGEGVEKNFNEAIKWFTLSANQEYDYGQYNLGRMYFFKNYGVQDYEKAFECFTLAANQGHDGAQNKLGIMYLSGFYVESNVDEAIKWFTLAANQDLAEAQYWLGEIYYYQRYGRQDYKKAFDYFMLAAKQGDSDAQNKLGVIYKNGCGTEVNINEAIKWLTLSAEQGNSYGHNNLGNIYYYEKFGMQDYKKAFKHFSISANNGNIYAQNKLGFMFKNGNGVEKNIDKSIEWFSLASEQGSSDAQFNLGVIYRFKEYGKVDYKKAFEYFLLSAEQGDNGAQCLLGKLYERGLGVEQNYEEALKLFTLASKQDSADGFFALGHMHEKGLGVKKDKHKAFEYYLQSAGKDDAEYDGLVAYMYQYGEGTEPNIEKAIYWHTKAAEGGYKDSQEELANIYEIGSGTPADPQKAMYYYSMAQKNNGKLTNKNKEDFSEMSISLLKLEKEHAEENPKLIGLGYYYGIGGNKNSKKAFKYLSIENKNNNTSHYYLAELYRNGDGIKKNPQKALELLMDGAKKSDPVCNYELGKIYQEGSQEFNILQDFDKAFDYYSASAVFNHSLAEYELGYMCYYGQGTKQSFSAAKKHFEKAKKYGVNCDLAITMVKRELGELGKNNKMLKCAKAFAKKNIPTNKIVNYCKDELREDLGNYWSVLSVDAQKCLITSLVTYFVNYSLGISGAEYLDFSNAINPMVKALEKELGHYLYTNYVSYLKGNNIPVNSFNGRRGFIAKESEYVYRYKDENELKDFTLGNIKQILGVENVTRMYGLNFNSMTPEEILEKTPEPNVVATKVSDHIEILKIDKPFYDYILTIFNKKAFAKNNPKAITEYIINLADEIKMIADTIRNPASHINVMTILKAEECGNYLIKDSKLILNFLKKLK